MRDDEYRRRLTYHDVPRRELARSPEAEIFVSYGQLRDHGVMFSRVHLRRLIEQEQFPRPLLLSANRIAWRISDLATWKASRPPALANDCDRAR
jgi:predicted DNA-binding transcriptional regulator AlpA